MKPPPDVPPATDGCPRPTSRLRRTANRSPTTTPRSSRATRAGRCASSPSTCAARRVPPPAHPRHHRLLRLRAHHRGRAPGRVLRGGPRARAPRRPRGRTDSRARPTATSCAPAAAPGSWRPPTAAPRRPAAGPSASTSASRTSSAPIPFITPGLSFEFRYFFMRKLWFAYVARAIIVFPGGFGTLDELFEFLTLSQTGKIDPPVATLLYGTRYWNEIVDFDALVRHGIGRRRRPQAAALRRHAGGGDGRAAQAPAAAGRGRARAGDREVGHAGGRVRDLRPGEGGAPMKPPPTSSATCWRASRARR